MGTGIDFGTTNSVLAVASQGKVALTTFEVEGKKTSSFRSLVYIPEDELETSSPQVLVGPFAIERYLEEQGGGRLIKSPKSFLASSFSGTQIGRKIFTVDELVGSVVRGLKMVAEAQFGSLPGPVVVGRPVRFVREGGDEKEDLALQRLREAFYHAGFPEIHFEYEPIAAAYSYEKELTHDETLFVADLGGGTSDFCIMKVGPSAKKLSQKERILATGGVGIAGDNFDAALLDRLVAPQLGKGTYYESFHRRVMVPNWIYALFCSWSRSVLLRERGNRKILEEVATSAEASQALQSFCKIVDENLHFYLQRAIGKTKEEVSTKGKGSFLFKKTFSPLTGEVHEDEFAQWIDRYLEDIEQALHATLERAKLSPSHINRVFATGGSSLVPSVQRMLARVFGKEKLAGGGEFTSVAQGLSLRADELAKTTL